MTPLLEDDVTLLTSVKRVVSKEAENEFREIQKEVGSKQMTEDGQKRKDIALGKVFYKRKKTRCIMHFYSATLSLLKQYVCLFETSSPMVHKLHDKQMELFKEFLACFLKPEVFNHMTAKSLKDKTKLNIGDKKNLISSRDMFMGKTTSAIISASHKQDSSMTSFLQSVHDAFVKCARYLQKKLPMGNQLLKSLSALDPLARGHSQTSQLLRKLPEVAKNVLSLEEEKGFDLEVRRFQVADLPPAHDEDENPVRLDIWWAQVQNIGYLSLCKMAFAVMSCFHGPAVEGSFNIMGDILDPRSCRMNISTYSSIQTVKYGMRAAGKTALQFFARKDILHGPVNSKVCRNIRASRKRYNEEQEEKRKAVEEKRQRLSLKAQQLQSKKKAKEARLKKQPGLPTSAKMKTRLEEMVAKKKSKKN